MGFFLTSGFPFPFQLLAKVIKGSEIHEILHGCPVVKQYLNSLYDCHYGEFFRLLAGVEQELKRDRYLFPHYAFYVREMKVRPRDGF